MTQEAQEAPADDQPAEAPAPAPTPAPTEAPAEAPAPEEAVVEARRTRGPDIEAIAANAQRERNEEMTRNGYVPVDTSAVPEPSPAPAPAPTPEPPPAPIQANQAELEEYLSDEELAAIGKRKVRLNVDGEPTVMTLEQMTRNAQKSGAADRRLREATELLQQVRDKVQPAQAPTPETQANVPPSAAPAPPAKASAKELAKRFVDSIYSGADEPAVEGLAAIIEQAQGAQAPRLDEDAIARRTLQLADEQRALQAVTAEYPEVNRNAYTAQAANGFYAAAVAEGLAPAEAMRLAAERTYEAFSFTKRTSETPPPATTPRAQQTQERKDRLDIPSARNVSSARTSVPIDSEASRSAVVQEMMQTRGRPLPRPRA